jgi:DNA-binding transcriptional LysR family regulator
MLRRLPPLNAVKAFEAAARSQSFTRAAEELNVTQWAVSQQVKVLEATLGIKLFNRERQRLVITEAGREYLAVVRDALDRIAVGTESLVQRQSSGVSERLFPVCSPKFISGRNRITTASDLLKFPLLRLQDWSTWTRWFEAAGVPAGHIAHGPILNSASMLIDAAVDGQGVALARTALAAWDLINGRLVRPIDVSLRMFNTYWIVCPKATSSVPKIATFRKWLLTEAAEDIRRLKTRISNHHEKRAC